MLEVFVNLNSHHIPYIHFIYVMTCSSTLQDDPLKQLPSVTPDSECCPSASDKKVTEEQATSDREREDTDGEGNVEDTEDGKGKGEEYVDVEGDVDEQAGRPCGDGNAQVRYMWRL